MNIGARLWGARFVGLALVAWCGLLAGCAPIRGYPNDPEDTDATLTRLAPYFDGKEEVKYLVLPEPARTLKRNEIVLARMRAYDIEFADFERKLYGDANAVSLGSDLLGLVLAGLTATTGNAATKSALGAASAGVLGANTAITKDLYYQKTVPALLAQMDADRLNAKAPILVGLKLSDADYPLVQAYVDLDVYKNAGSIPGAINVINQQAADAKDVAQANITFQRTSARAQLQGIVPVRAQLQTLATDAQYLALARAMQPFLATRSPAVQQLVKTLDPTDLRLSGNARRARRVINAWIDEDDVSPVNQQQWLSAIAAAAR
jgi:hypothetical protein